AIQYALTYPERHPNQLPPLDLAKLSSLHFEPPDIERFPCISLAYRALRSGGTIPAAMNAANEEAVRAFIEEHISLTDIPRVIERVMNEHESRNADTLEAVLSADRDARALAQSVIASVPRSVESS